NRCNGRSPAAAILSWRLEVLHSGEEEYNHQARTFESIRAIFRGQSSFTFPSTKFAIGWYNWDALVLPPGGISMGTNYGHLDRDIKISSSHEIFTPIGWIKDLRQNLDNGKVEEAQNSCKEMAKSSSSQGVSSTKNQWSCENENVDAYY
ncbi:hypothetical protein HAX54_040755, partial [Datura stramonium]|nr:hypothetical protein [Datura stramonium]